MPTVAELERSPARITATGDPETAAAEADVVSESLPEDPKLKGSVLGQFNRLRPSGRSSPRTPEHCCVCAGSRARRLVVHSGGGAGRSADRPGHAGGRGSCWTIMLWLGVDSPALQRRKTEL
jgi:hypothetical protein